MPGVLPEGEPLPADGSLPGSALGSVGGRGFGIYVHVPFCASRCGYCDFNTYAPGEGVDRDGYVDAVLGELELARRVLGDRPPRRVDTVFVGGGTPTLLPAADLNRILAAVDRVWGLSPDVEVTTEANPESVRREQLADLVAGGFNRLSLGMQSASDRVLSILDRQHAPGQALEVAALARDVGFAHVNLDLIYGTPGETGADFAESLALALKAEVDHISAYALIVEDGTRLAARMRRGELPYPDDDVSADRYLAAERLLTEAGLFWYEVSNWARSGGDRCRHNLLYWTGGDWWGLGPGAHSHVGGVRWWNVKHPGAYRERVAAGVSPGQAREVLTVTERRVEDVMLRLRLDSGVQLSTLDDAGAAGAARAFGNGLLEPEAYGSGRAVLTLRGRLLADAVTRDLLP